MLNKRLKLTRLNLWNRRSRIPNGKMYWLNFSIKVPHYFDWKFDTIFPFKREGVIEIKKKTITFAKKTAKKILRSYCVEILTILPRVNGLCCEKTSFYCRRKNKKIEKLVKREKKQKFLRIGELKLIDVDIKNVIRSVTFFKLPIELCNCECIFYINHL